MTDDLRKLFYRLLSFARLSLVLTRHSLGNWVNGTKILSGAPSLYGANFQAITWAQQNAGYLDAAGAQPNKSLGDAFDTADERLGEFISFLKSGDKLDTTLLLIGSKQGQGPIDPKTEVVIDPDSVQDGAGVDVAFFVGEDGGIVCSMPTKNPIP
jgi:hypothetical protein